MTENGTPLIAVAAFVLALALLIVMTMVLIRQPHAASTKKPWALRIEVTHTLSAHSIALLGDQLDHMMQLTPTTIGLIGELFDQAAKDYHARAIEAQQLVPRATELVTPPEPEERIARDFDRAKVVLRGADELLKHAAAAGRHLSRSDAMKQSASMVYGALDSDD